MRWIVRSAKWVVGTGVIFRLRDVRGRHSENRGLDLKMPCNEKSALVDGVMVHDGGREAELLCSQHSQLHHILSIYTSSHTHQSFRHDPHHF